MEGRVSLLSWLWTGSWGVVGRRLPAAKRKLGMMIADLLKLLSEGFDMSAHEIKGFGTFGDD